MMKIKNLIFIILACSTIFIAACSGSNNTVQVVTSAFIGGSEGLIVSFEPFSIQEDGIFTVFDTEDFPIEVAVQNKGEQTVEPGQVTVQLLGPAQNSFSNIPAWMLTNAESIEKISEFNPDGGEEIVSFTSGDYAAYIDPVVGFVDVTWNLNYAYEYATHLIVNDVCFKGDLRDDRVCEVQETKTFSVSGAPITVTSVEEDNAGQGIVVLKIDIENVQTGESTFIGQDFDNRFSQVGYTVDEPDVWSCKSGGRENEARLIDGQAQIICRLKNPLTEDDLYSQPVTLTLDYVYQDLITEVLRIKQSAE
jgi:hypothetical protein